MTVFKSNQKNEWKIPSSFCDSQEDRCRQNRYNPSSNPHLFPLLFFLPPLCVAVVVVAAALSLSLSHTHTHTRGCVTLFFVCKKRARVCVLNLNKSRRVTQRLAQSRLDGDSNPAVNCILIYDLPLLRDCYGRLVPSFSLRGDNKIFPNRLINYNSRSRRQCWNATQLRQMSAGLSMTQ